MTERASPPDARRGLPPFLLPVVYVGVVAFGFWTFRDYLGGVFVMVVGLILLAIGFPATVAPISQTRAARARGEDVGFPQRRVSIGVVVLAIALITIGFGIRGMLTDDIAIPADELPEP